MIQIGMNYENQEMIVLFCSNINNKLSLEENLIKNLNFRSNKYEKHVDKVKTILIEFLQKNVIN